MAIAQQEGSGRERILAAAIDLFGARGVDAVTVRQIAAAADVSPALVVHHFGSKAGLKAVADERVLALIGRVRADMLAGANAARTAPDQFGTAALMNLVQNEPLAAYIRRILMDGGPAASELFASFHGNATGLQRTLIEAGFARPTDDVETRVAVILGASLSLLVLREPMTATLGYDPLTPHGIERWLAEARGLIFNGMFLRP